MSHVGAVTNSFCGAVTQSLERGLEAPRAPGAARPPPMPQPAVNCASWLYGGSCPAAWTPTRNGTALLQVADDEWKGFHSWLRAKRAAEDRPRLWLSAVSRRLHRAAASAALHSCWGVGGCQPALRSPAALRVCFATPCRPAAPAALQVCILPILVRISGELSMAHELYFALNLYFVLLLVAWSHGSPASYARWRDAPAVALRLNIFFAPAFLALYQLTVNGPGSTLPPTTGLLLAAGPVFLTTLVLQLHVYAAIHTLPLWPAVLVQCVCELGAGGLPSRMAVGCTSRLNSHPSAQRLVRLAFRALNRLSLVQPPATAQHDYQWVCRHSVLGLQLIVGVLGSLAVQAVADARAFHEFKKARRQGQTAAVFQCGGSLYDKACDALSRRYLLRAAGWSRHPGLLFLAAILIWNVLVWVYP